MTTGEIANGRSSSALSSALPRKRPRASASAMSTPKTALSGTAIAVTSIVSQNAEIAAGVVIESHDGADAVLERAVEDQPDRREQQQREVAERDDAQPDAPAALNDHGAPPSVRGRGSRAARRARSAAAPPTPPRR